MEPPPAPPPLLLPLLLPGDEVVKPSKTFRKLNFFILKTVEKFKGKGGLIHGIIRGEKCLAFLSHGISQSLFLHEFFKKEGGGINLLSNFNYKKHILQKYKTKTPRATVFPPHTSNFQGLYPQL